MAYAVALKKTASGAIATTTPADWFPDFQSGDTATRRALLESNNDGSYTLTELTKEEYFQALEIVYAAERAADRAAYVTLRDNYRAFRRKFKVVLTSNAINNALNQNGETPFTVAELLAAEQLWLEDVAD